MPIGYVRFNLVEQGRKSCQIESQQTPLLLDHIRFEDSSYLITVSFIPLTAKMLQLEYPYLEVAIPGLLLMIKIRSRTIAWHCTLPAWYFRASYIVVASQGVHF